MARRRRQRNPLGELPYDEWIPTEAVRFNDDGSISLQTQDGVAEYGTLENRGRRRRNARVEDLRDGLVYVYMTNFGYYAGDSFSTLREAIKWAQSRGFEAQFVRDGQDLGSWTPFGGVRLKRQYEHEYYG